MSIQPFFTATAAAQALPNFFPMTAAGTYTIPSVPVGVYKIETSTNQSFTVQFVNSSGYRFSSFIQGGQGFISIPMECTQITIPGGLTYGPILTYTRTSYTQGAAPSSVSWTYNANGSFTVAQGTIAHTSPAGTTSTVVYWTNGNSTALGAGTPTATTTMQPNVGIAGQSRSFALVCKDANGVEGMATVVSAPTSPVINYAQLFTSNGTFTTPVGVTALKVIAQAGGGGGAGNTGFSDTNYNQYAAGGGGGAGGYAYNGLIPVFASTNYAVVVGGGGNTAGTGNNSTFNATTVVGNGGGRGGDYNTANAGAGGCGGGGGFDRGTSRAGASGNQQFNGAAGPGPNNSSARGGGGGGTGGNASGASGGASASFTQITPAGTLTLGGGGNGGTAGGSGGTVGGYGAGGGSGQGGASGMVCIGYTV
jgi:hypothetical protein